MTTDDSSTPAWPEHDATPASGLDSATLTGLLDAQRLLLNRLAASALPPKVAREVTARLNELAAVAAEHEVSEWQRVDGWRRDLPGRASALFPPYVLDEQGDGRVAGRVTFTRFFLGGNGATHGGTPPLLFDDVLGRVVHVSQSRPARTAFLKVNYRRITPIDVELRFEATCDSVDGRKRWATARIFGPDGAVLCDAESLFLELLPGQQ